MLCFVSCMLQCGRYSSSGGVEGGGDGGSSSMSRIVAAAKNWPRESHDLPRLKLSLCVCL